MENLSHLANGILVVLTPYYLIFCLLGVPLGQAVGALPGIGPSAGIAILLPLTFGSDPIASFVAGTFGAVGLMVAAPALASAAIAFGPPENFALSSWG